MFRFQAKAQVQYQWPPRNNQGTEGAFMIRHFNPSPPFKAYLMLTLFPPRFSLNRCRPPHFKHKHTEWTLQRGRLVHTVEGQEGCGRMNKLAARFFPIIDESWGRNHINGLGFYFWLRIQVEHLKDTVSLLWDILTFTCHIHIYRWF